MASATKRVNNQGMKEMLFSIISHWTHDYHLAVAHELFVIVCQYYGKGDILIVFMDRLQIYNLISPNTININPPISINQLSNPFTFRCSAISREYDTNDILFIGGSNEKKGRASNDVQLYSINDNRFYALSPCNDPRSDARSVMHNKYECITFGGHQKEAIDSVEMYSFITNKWVYLPSLPAKNLYFAAASAQKSRQIFIAGGQSSYAVHNTCSVLQQYTENVDYDGWKWTQLKTMIDYNGWCEGLYWDKFDRFLVVGGIRRTRNIDSYDVFKNEWCRLPQAKYDHHMGVCAIWNNYIVWIGDDRKMCNIELFDTKSNQWISKHIRVELQPPYKKARVWKWI